MRKKSFILALSAMILASCGQNSSQSVSSAQSVTSSDASVSSQAVSSESKPSTEVSSSESSPSFEEPDVVTDTIIIDGASNPYDGSANPVFKSASGREYQFEVSFAEATEDGHLVFSEDSGRSGYIRNAKDSPLPRISKIVADYKVSTDSLIHYGQTYENLYIGSEQMPPHIAQIIDGANYFKFGGIPGGYPITSLTITFELESELAPVASFSLQEHIVEVEAGTPVSVECLTAHSSVSDRGVTSSDSNIATGKIVKVDGKTYVEVTAHNDGNATLTVKTTSGLKDALYVTAKGQKLKDFAITDVYGTPIDGNKDLDHATVYLGVKPISDSLAKIKSVEWEASYVKRYNIDGTYKFTLPDHGESTIRIYDNRKCQVVSANYNKTGTIDDDWSVSFDGDGSSYLKFSLSGHNLIVNGRYNFGQVVLSDALYARQGDDAPGAPNKDSLPITYDAKPWYRPQDLECSMTLNDVYVGVVVNVKAVATDFYDEDNKIEKSITLTIVSKS